MDSLNLCEHVKSENVISSDNVGHILLNFKISTPKLVSKGNLKFQQTAFVYSFKRHFRINHHAMCVQKRVSKKFKNLPDILTHTYITRFLSFN